jgi:hypothetical protein
MDAEMATGTVSLTSSMVDLSGSPIGCDRIDPGETLLRMSSLTGSPITEALPCAISSVTSSPVSAGVYDVTPELRSAGSLLAVAADQRGVVVWSGADTPLSPVSFVVDATGDLAISLRAGAASGNCIPLASGGAGITTMTITMTRTVAGGGSGCAAITLTRRRGNETIGQYVINCSTPMVAGCIENDEVLTASSMASGAYRIIVAGRILARDCWSGDGMMQVPAGRRTLVTELELIGQARAGCPSLLTSRSNP